MSLLPKLPLNLIMKPNIFESTDLASKLHACGFCLWDIGARGGMDPYFAPFAFAIDAVGFEPDPEAFTTLSPSGAWRSEKFFQTAIGGADTRGILNIPEDPEGASFLEHDPEIGDRYGLQDLFNVKRRVDVPQVTMEEAVNSLGVPAPNLLKLDVEGLELDILRGGTRFLKGVVAVKLEAAFLRHRIAQPLAGDLIAFLEGQGLYPVDIVDVARWRKRPWAAEPYLVRGNPAFSRGRLAQADIIFLREPNTLSSEMQMSAGLAAIGLGYFDHGLELLHKGAEGDLRDAVYAASVIYGRARAGQALRNAIWQIARLCRALARGLNVPPEKD